jgi:hypothetical protein
MHTAFTHQQHEASLLRQLQMPAFQPSQQLMPAALPPLPAALPAHMQAHSRRDNIQRAYIHAHDKDLAGWHDWKLVLDASVLCIVLRETRKDAMGTAIFFAFEKVMRTGLNLISINRQANYLHGAMVKKVLKPVMARKATLFAETTTN